MANRQVGVIGASSFVGHLLLPRLVDAGCDVTALTRQDSFPESDTHINWCRFIYPQITQMNADLRLREKHLWKSAKSADRFGSNVNNRQAGVIGAVIPYWISAAPIWVLPEHFSLLEGCGARRIVVLSSTSRFTKKDSIAPSEQGIAQRLAQGERDLQVWADAQGVELVILRPTLIYGLGKDKNIIEIARFIHRFGFFPLLGRARGLRQPVHADYVAQACVSALLTKGVAGSYNLSGGETLPYREMVERIFLAMSRPVRVISVPLWLFHLGVSVMRLLPRYRHWTSAMAQRMNQALVFDHGDAVADLGYKPRAFSLTAKDLPL